MKFANLLLDWYATNARELPWRENIDPYRIWVSEIILQQTRIDQGINYYLRFISKFPNLKKLAEASIDEVLSEWQGLGYYSRARNMHYAAQYVMSHLNGVFPESYSELIKLKGIGKYTAGAIASIAYNEPVAVVDGNVYRLFSRLFLIDTPINSPAGEKIFYQMVQDVLPKDHPGNFNQALMDFGSMICKPRNPECSSCVFNFNCMAYKEGSQDKFPVKKKIKDKKLRYFYILLIVKDEKVYIKKRIGKDIWKGLYEFPFVETGKNMELEELMERTDIIAMLEPEYKVMKELTSRKHILSHQNLRINAVFIKGEMLVNEENTYLLVPVNELDKYPFSRLHLRIIDEFLQIFYSI